MYCAWLVEIKTILSDLHILFFSMFYIEYLTVNCAINSAVVYLSQQKPTTRHGLVSLNTPNILTSSNSVQITPTELPFFSPFAHF
jgi:hypothetical protein